MKTNPIIVLLLLQFSFIGQAQKKEVILVVKPYLKDASPNSIKILWETSGEEESIVERGPTPKLGKKTTGRYVYNKQIISN